ncbi:unnamed protein product, partial [marine sediment metagenome]
QAAVPVLGGAAFQNQGIQPLLDAIVHFLPSPIDIPPIRGIDSGEIRMAEIEQPFSALAFKVVTDRYAGRLVFIRVYSGRAKVGEYLLNSSTGQNVR